MVLWQARVKVETFYSTSDVARKSGISRVTLQEWIRQGKLRPPKVVRVGGVKVRLWTPRDLRRLQAMRKAIYHKRQMVRAK